MAFRVNYFFKCAALVQDVDGMMSISTEAAEARASLKEDRELVRTFEVSFPDCITIIVVFRHKTQFFSATMYELQSVITGRSAHGYPSIAQC